MGIKTSKKPKESQESINTEVKRSCKKESSSALAKHYKEKNQKANVNLENEKRTAESEIRLKQIKE